MQIYKQTCVFMLFFNYFAIATSKSMILPRYISQKTVPFSEKTTVKEVNDFFKNKLFTHFPVVSSEEKLLGLISKVKIKSIKEQEKPLEDIIYCLERFSVYKTENIIEILNTFTLNKSNILPVLNKELMYIGYITLFNAVSFYGNKSFFKEQGEVLTIQKQTQNLSFSEISQIVESSNGKLVSIFKEDTINENSVVTLKFSSNNVNEIIQSFRRYGYKIITKHKEDVYLDNLKERADYLQKYLNI